MARGENNNARQEHRDERGNRLQAETHAGSNKNKLYRSDKNIEHNITSCSQTDEAPGSV